jgi:hypothetical protein
MLNYLKGEYCGSGIIFHVHLDLDFGPMADDEKSCESKGGDGYDQGEKEFGAQSQVRGGLVEALPRPLQPF